MSQLDAQALYADLLIGVRALLRPDSRLVGIWSGGAWLAEMLHRDLCLTGEYGVITSALHRDDFAAMTGFVLATAAVAAGQTPGPKPVEPAVRAMHEAALRALPFTDRQDFDDARRGFIATLPEAERSGRYAFLDAETAPDTVHPSLWRLARPNTISSTSYCSKRSPAARRRPSRSAGVMAGAPPLPARHGRLSRAAVRERPVELARAAIHRAG